MSDKSYMALVFSILVALAVFVGCLPRVVPNHNDNVQERHSR